MSARFNKTLAAAALAALAVAPGIALAHHSYAAFDRSRQVSITGTVISWEWTNPHSHLQVMAPDANGKAMKPWDLELSSPNILRSSGWARDSLKPGDKVTVVLYPRRDGVLGGNPITVTAPDGHVYGRAAPGAPAAGGGVERQ